MNARDEALQHLLRARLPGWDSGRLPLPRERDANTDARDIGLGLAISRAVTKNLLLLHHLIAHYSGRQVNQVDPLVQMVLAIALAQLRFFERLPPYAVVDQAVEQAKSLRLGKASGFVNAILRRALRDPDARLPERSFAQVYANIVLSHPPELFARLEKVMGAERALQVAERNNQEAPLIVRRIASEMPTAPEGVTITPHQREGMFVVQGANEALLSEWSEKGIAQAQDPTSAAIVDPLALPLTPGQRPGSEPEADGATSGRQLRICDRCCGVGTKTMQIAELATGADVLAIDAAKHRIGILERTIAQRGAANVRTHIGRVIPKGEAAFDRILIDAPCSNSGVLIRRPEAKYRQTDDNLRSVEQLQRQILADTVPHLAAGGILVYGTCSIWPEENERQIEWLLAQHPELTLSAMQTLLPGVDPDPTKHHDGGFWAVLKRSA